MKHQPAFTEPSLYQMSHGPLPTPERLPEDLQFPVLLLHQAGRLGHLRLEQAQLTVLLPHQGHLPLQLHLLLLA